MPTDKKKRPRFTTCAVIPCLDCGKTLPGLSQKAAHRVDALIVVDDGSAMPVKAAQLEKLPHSCKLHIVRHQSNRGYGASIADGMGRAVEMGFDCIVLLDGDGQHPPEQIPKLIAPILAHRADVVIGSRYLGLAAEGIPWWRDIGIRAITLAFNLRTGLALTDCQSGFRAFSRQAAHACLPHERGMEASLEILLKARETGQRIVEVPARIRYPPKNGLTLGPWIRGPSLIAFLVKNR